MFRKTLIIFIALLCCNLSIINAQSNDNIEILDIEKDVILKTTAINPNVQLETEKIIKEIDGIVKKLNPIPSKGYMIKIPLEPSYKLENTWMNDLIDEVIIIIPEEEGPYLVTFDDENRPYFFTFQAKIDSLLDILEFSF